MIPAFYEKMSNHIKGMWMVVNSLFSGIWVFLHDGKIIRRTAFVGMWYVTFEAYHFCYRAAAASGWDAAAIAACFGILTPVSVLQAAIMKFYNDARNADLQEKSVKS
jgi:hypothetical protein